MNFGVKIMIHEFRTKGVIDCIQTLVYCVLCILDDVLPRFHRVVYDRLHDTINHVPKGSEDPQLAIIREENVDKGMSLGAELGRVQSFQTKV